MNAAVTGRMGMGVEIGDASMGCPSRVCNAQRPLNPSRQNGAKVCNLSDRFVRLYRCSIVNRNPGGIVTTVLQPAKTFYENGQSLL